MEIFPIIAVDGGGKCGKDACTRMSASFVAEGADERTSRESYYAQKTRAAQERCHDEEVGSAELEVAGHLPGFERRKKASRIDDAPFDRRRMKFRCPLQENRLADGPHPPEGRASCRERREYPPRPAP